MRATLPKSRDGQISRLLGSLVGDAAVESVRSGSGDFYWPVPVGGELPILTYKGEFFWRSVGESRHLRGAPELPSLAALRAAPAPVMGAGFTSLDDLILEATSGGKQQSLPYAKTGAVSVAGGAEVGWVIAGMPGAGAAPSAIAAGSVPTNATAGALGQNDPSGTDTLHLTTINMTAQGNAAFGVLYDRIWHGATNTNSATQQTVSGTPTRYATTTSPGNFAYAYSRSTVAATAHNHDAGGTPGCTYTDNANGASNFPAVTGNSGNVAGRIDTATAGQWYWPLESGDTGVRAITAWKFSAAMASGQIDLVLGHPLAFVPMPASGVPGIVDGINSAFNMQQILAGACIDFLWVRPATGATSVNGFTVLVSG